jgi:hypothetical protein
MMLYHCRRRLFVSSSSLHCLDIPQSNLLACSGCLLGTVSRRKGSPKAFGSNLVYRPALFGQQFSRSFPSGTLSWSTRWCPFPCRQHIAPNRASSESPEYRPSVLALVLLCWPDRSHHAYRVSGSSIPGFSINRLFLAALVYTDCPASYHFRGRRPHVWRAPLAYQYLQRSVV